MAASFRSPSGISLADLWGAHPEGQDLYLRRLPGHPPKERRIALIRVPTLAERCGDLSDLATPIFNPCTGSNCNVFRQSATVRRRSHSHSLIAPQARALLSFIPLPNVSELLATRRTILLQASASKQRLVRRPRGPLPNREASHVRPLQLPNVGQNAPGAFGYAGGGPNFATVTFRRPISAPDQSLAIGLDYSIRPAWLEDFRFGWFHYGCKSIQTGLAPHRRKTRGSPA